MKRSYISAVVAIVLAGTLAMPERSAHAWVAAGGWRGGIHVASFHPYPCYAGVAAGAVAGLAIGAAMRPAPVVYAPSPVVVVNQQPTYYAAPSMGSSVTTLPPGAQSLVVNGTQYYQSGGTWYRPYFGSNGVYYTIVPTP